MRDVAVTILFLLGAITLSIGALFAINYLGNAEEGPERPGNATSAKLPPLQVDQLDVPADVDCYGDPKQAGCAKFRVPEKEIAQKLKEICAGNETVGCSLWRACQAQHSSSSSSCTPFALLRFTCSDALTSAACQQSRSLCQAGSVVEQCQLAAALPAGMQTGAVQTAVQALCENHPMGACRNCQGGQCGRPLDTLSQLCKGMPDSPYCIDFFMFCQNSGIAFPSLCGADSARPPMRMYFHATFSDIILFRNWVPRNSFQYFVTCLGVVFMAILSQATKVGRLTWEAQWRASVRTQSGPPAIITQGQMKRNFVRAAFTGIAALLDFSLMLIAMTFNVGLFLCIIAGLALGVLFLGHVNEVPFQYRGPGDKVPEGENIQIVIGNSSCHNDSM